jgi:hypothetical protein
VESRYRGYRYRVNVEAIYRGYRYRVSVEATNSGYLFKVNVEATYRGYRFRVSVSMCGGICVEVIEVMYMEVGLLKWLCIVNNRE